MAHEWFANMVTAADWKDMWLHEGIATYIEMLYAEEIGGQKGYEDWVESRRKRITNEKPIIQNKEHLSIQEAFHMDIYYKGAVILHTLRYLIGKEAILEILKRFLYPNPNILDGRSNTRLINSDEFIKTVESVSGQDLDWFFDAYLYHKDLPTLVVRESNGQLSLKWQTSSKLAFEMPVKIKMEGKDVTLEMPAGEAKIMTNGAPYSIDPDNSILKNVIIKE
jgi:aminopeptidase N